MPADEKKVKQVIELMELVMNDNSIPKNIRRAVSEAREIMQTQEDLVVRASTAVYKLDEVSEDINMPMHARTQIWTILSALETIKN
ncbi:MAG: UPF0147 family protein [Candidatus Micrarchaeota archaeon]